MRIIAKESFMKNKFKLYGIIVLIAIIGLSITGCDNDGDSSNTGGSGNTSLAGTRWTCIFTDKGYEGSQTINFTSATTGVLTTAWSNPSATPTPPISFTYTLSGDIVAFILQDGSTATGTIYGNKLSVPDGEGGTQVFTKE